MGFCVDVAAGLRWQSLGEFRHDDKGAAQHGASRSALPARTFGGAGALGLWRCVREIGDCLAAFGSVGISDVELSGKGYGVEPHV
jgi:hypothetical protein